jgi:outer membrane protein assembly factor BamB
MTAALAICTASTLQAQSDWPTFRGPDRTGVAPDTGLLTEWPEGGPELIWQGAGAGRGYASVVIADGQLYTLGDQLSTAKDGDEYLSCFDLKTGKQLWRALVGPAFEMRQKAWESSRSTPTVDGERVYVISPKGVLVCVSSKDGSENWRVDLTDEYGGKKAEMWGYSESVLIDGDNLICTPGAPKNTMVALNKETGKKIWSTPRKGDRGAGHASIVISNVGDTRVYVQTTGSGAMGVRAKDGELMWTYDFDKTTAIIPTPIVRDDLVFVAAGYSRGGALLRQVADGDKVKIEEVYPLNPKLCNKHGGIVLVGDYLYGDSDDKGTPFCAEFMTGKIQWKSRGSGKKSASIVAADGHLYILYSNGTMTLVKADPESMQEISHFKVPGSGERPSWAHPVILDGRLYLREGDNVLCYNISGGDASSTSAKTNDKSANELLTNGDFSKGMDGWQVEHVDEKTGQAEIVKEGPEGGSALKLKVLSVPDEPWKIQAFQPNLKFEKGKSYVMTFWAKSTGSEPIKVLCMQNHEPWEHSTEQEIYLTDEWKKYEFKFDGPWDDDNGRITFTNLGTNKDRIYWFTNVSLENKVIGD